ncbi:MAG: PAS domain S-box protein, partial [Desulfobulbaceae bacterium]|nr:PAS domain S-box protein [Desulfobulbaceae bacterium]
RKLAEEALFESEELSKLILSRSMDGFFSSDGKGRFVDANEAYCNLVGYSREQLLEMAVPDLEARETAEEVAHHIEALIRTGSERFESQHRHRDGHLVDIELSITYDSSRGDLFFAFVRDISARKRVETELRENEEKFRLIFESSTDAIFQVDPEGNITFMNRAGAEMFGYTPEEIIGQHFSLLVPENAVAEGAIALQQALAGKNAKGEIPVMHKRGDEFTVSFSLAPLKKGEQIVGVTGISRDITDRLKEEEEQLRASLAEKESLLKEIHHRVKNNMQIVSSLLSLQSMRSTNPEVRTAIDDSKNRVKTMGLIHEKLYKTENLARIDFSDYIKTLTEYLSSTYISSVPVQIIIEAQDIFLSADTAIPCGLIITELITNSFKYAFMNRQQGRIEITLVRTADNRIALSICDDGSGLPSDFNIDEADSLGMNLVQNLARQLGATLTFQNDNGAVCRMEFAADGE